MEAKMPEIRCEKVEEFSEDGRKFLRYWGTSSFGGKDISIFIPKLSLDLQGLELTGETIREAGPSPYPHCTTTKGCIAFPLEQDKNDIFFQLETKEEDSE